MSFALGQRWVSDTESDLGLGTVVGIDGRMVTVLFPASGETRLYANTGAPITRVIFNVGDTVKCVMSDRMPPGVMALVPSDPFANPTILFDLNVPLEKKNETSNSIPLLPGDDEEEG